MCVSIRDVPRVLPQPWRWLMVDIEVSINGRWVPMDIDSRLI